MTEIVYKELSYEIMQAVYEVHSIIGPGFNESTYEKALCQELKLKGIKFEREQLIKIFYKGNDIGDYRMDLVVEGKIVLEAKAVSEMNEAFAAQLYSYLKASGLKLGILINFGKKKVEYKRIVN